MIRQPLNALWAAASLFAAACLVILWAADFQLTDGPRFGSEESPLVIEGERLLDCLPADDKRIGRLKDGVRLYANLDMLFHAFTEEQASTLYLVARGKRLYDVPPVLTVEVDRELRGHIFVESEEWALYRVDLEIPPGEHRFRIRYINDRSRFPTNRDVDLKLVALGARPLGWEPYVRTEHIEPLMIIDKKHLVPSPPFDLSSGADIRQDGSITLRTNGYLGRRVSGEEARIFRLTVVARGDLCEGAGPRMLIMENDDQLVSFDVDDTEFRSYTIPIALDSKPIHEILIVYENDLYVPGVCDRNLHVRDMRLEKL